METQNLIDQLKIVVPQIMDLGNKYVIWESWACIVVFVIFSILAIIAGRKLYQHKNEFFDNEGITVCMAVYVILLMMLVGIGVPVTCSAVVDLFNPEFAAIKQLVPNVK
jgi:membrane-associated HD superfamily phosphohydrolase